MKSADDNATPHAADEYDAKVRRVIPFYEMMHEETIRLVKAAKPDARLWLDTGCGTGFLVEKALSEFPQTHFLLADPAKAMCDKARERLAAFIPDRVEILPKAPTEGLPEILDRRVDVITAVQSHHYLDAKGRRQATRASFEMLLPGALYITFENVRPLTPRGIEVALHRMKAFQMSQGLSADYADAHAKRFDSGYFPITVEDHLALLTSVGFSTAEIFWYSVMQAGFYAVR